MIANLSRYQWYRDHLYGTSKGRKGGSKITVSFATALAVAMLACCTYKTGREINTAAISDVVIGQSNKEQVETWFGPPSNIFMMATGETWIYTSTKTDIRGSTFIPYANLFNHETVHRALLGQGEQHGFGHRYR